MKYQRAMRRRFSGFASPFVSSKIVSMTSHAGSGPADALPDPNDITQALARVRRLDDEAAEELLPIVYDELRRLAAACMSRESADHTLQPTAVVHEAFVKLTQGADAEWSSRAQFFGIAARAMRQILVDHARRRHADKRGGAAIERVTLSGLVPQADDPGGNHADRVVDVLALHEALEILEQMDRRMASVIELRFFAGLTIAQTADVLGISHSTVDDDWSFARAWLRRKLEGDER